VGKVWVEGGGGGGVCIGWGGGGGGEVGYWFGREVRWGGELGGWFGFGYSVGECVVGKIFKGCEGFL